MKVPTGTAAIMTADLARATAQAPRHDEPASAVPLLAELSRAAVQSLDQLRLLVAEGLPALSSPARDALAQRLQSLQTALAALPWPQVRGSGWWPLGRSREREELAAAEQACAALADDLRATGEALSAWMRHLRDTAQRMQRLHTRIEVECHALDQAVDTGRRKAGGVIEALQRQAVLAVEDADRSRRIEESRRLTAEFTARIDPMARAAADAREVAELLKAGAPLAEAERREARLVQSLTEWQQASNALDSAARVDAAREATSDLAGELTKLQRLVHTQRDAEAQLAAAVKALEGSLAAR